MQVWCGGDGVKCDEIPTTKILRFKGKQTNGREKNKIKQFKLSFYMAINISLVLKFCYISVLFFF